MNSPNTQKTISVFLVLAALTSSFVFLLSNTKVAVPANPAGQGAQQITVDGKSVFVEKYTTLPGYTSPLFARSDIGVPSSGIVSDTFTDQLIQKVLAANPNGPDLTSKNPLILPKNYGDMGGISNIVAMSFGPQLQDKKIKVSQKYTAEDIFNYLSASQSALDNILAPSLSDLSNQTISLQSLGDISSMYDRTENKIYETPVPAPLARFNRALLGFIDVQRTFFNQADPAKTLIALQNPKLVLDPYQKAVGIEANSLKESLPKLISSLGESDRAIGMLNAVLGIQTAYAFSDFIGGVSNIINAILKALSNVYQYLSNALQNLGYFGKILTEVLKNLLVKKLSAQTVSWVGGGGEPKYVQNWQSFLGNSFNTAAGGIISKYAPQLCSNFGPLVQVVLTPPSPQGAGYSPGSNPYSCTPDMVAANLAGFARNFESGGWLAYGALQQPQNNYYGTLLQLSEASAEAGSRAQEASKNSASAASGFLSTKDCKDTSTVNPDDYGGGVSSESDARALFADAFISCSDAKCSSVIICNPENPNALQETTPGKLVSDTLSKNLGGSPLERIVNANDLTGLLSALINSALSKLVELGTKGLTNLTADKLAADNGSLADTCKGLTGDALTKCQAENKDANTAAMGASTKGVVVPKIQSVLKFKSQILNEANKIVAVIDQALGSLDTASSTCAVALDAASSTLDGSNTLSFIDQSMGELKDKRDFYNGIIKDLTVPGTQDKTIAHLNAIVSSLQSDDIKSVAKELNITLSSSADERQKTEQFYNDLSLAIDNPGSVFGNLFGTLDSSAGDVGDAKTYEVSLSVPQGCGILERATRLTSLEVDSNPACSIAVVENSCTPKAP